MEFKPTNLTMLPNLPICKSTLGPHPPERHINRQLLLDISPDREGLIDSDLTVEELRHELKLKAFPTTGGQTNWIYQSRINSEIDLIKESAIRRSTFINGATSENDLFSPQLSDTASMFSTSDAGFSRVLSRTASRQSSHPLVSPTIANVLTESEAPWAQLQLSSPFKMISPRVLGPTHMLIVCSADREPCVCMECPINDLLFTLSCPNLSKPLPPRLPTESPRVALSVPHVDTFPDLVVYLHTRNQAGLFRSVLPDWIRDILHPLPAAASPGIPSRSTLRRKQKSMSWLGMRTRLWFPLRSIGARRSDISLSTAITSNRSLRTYDTVAQEIAEVDDSIQHLSHKITCPKNLFDSVVRLNALKDNLEHIGYYSSELWKELDVTWEILVRAINFKARMAFREDQASCISPIRPRVYPASL